MQNLIAQNRKALHDYEMLEKFEAGVVLAGQEVKSAKDGHFKLQGAYVLLQKGEAWLLGAEIPPYRLAGRLPLYDPARSRKLLLHKRELKYLLGKTQEKGLTVIPISVYTKRGKIKLEIGLARGRGRRDKRELIKKREDQRRIARAMKLRR
jgi:SsrA-binding protein